MPCDVYYVLLEGRFAEEQLVGQDSQAPGVDLLAVAFVAQLLRRGVLETSDHCCPQA